MSKTRNGLIGAAAAAALAGGGVFLVSDTNGQQVAETVLCALADDQDNIDSQVDAKDSECPPDPAGKPQWRWLPVEDTNPDYDPKAQVKTGPVVTVEPAVVTRVWTVRTKTQEEIAAEQDAAIAAQEPIVTMVCDHDSRISVLEGTGPVTAEECHNELKVENLKIQNQKAEDQKQ